MDAKIYNEKRRIIFCTANDPKRGFAVAKNYLENYKHQLGNLGYIGLKAELSFYENYRKEFGLTVAGDMGEHADFCGLHSSAATRFDVTTNVNYKKFEQYEPFMDHGAQYRIVVMDQVNFQVTDIIPLSFDRCHCGGYLMPFVLLFPENFNDNGESTWSHEQQHLLGCSDCQTIKEVANYNDHIETSHEHLAELPEDIKLNGSDPIAEYVFDCYKYCRRHFSDDLVALAEPRYKITQPDGDGFWTVDFPMINSVVATKFPQDMDFDIH